VVPACKSTPVLATGGIQGLRAALHSPIQAQGEETERQGGQPVRKQTAPVRPSVPPKPGGGNTRATSEPPTAQNPPMVLSGGEPTSGPTSLGPTSGPGPNQDSPMPDLLSLKDRLKLFEKEIDSQSAVPEPKKDRKFSFLSDDEVVKMKEEEARRIASMTALDLEAFDSLTSHLSLEEDAQTVRGQVEELDKYDCSSAAEPGAGSQSGSLNTSSDNLSALTEAEKKAAWRKARLDSLEDDAMQAQIVIEKMSELNTTGTTAGRQGSDNSQFLCHTDTQGNITGCLTHQEEQEEGVSDSDCLTTSEDTNTVSGPESPDFIKSSARPPH